MACFRMLCFGEGAPSLRNPSLMTSAISIVARVTRLYCSVPRVVVETFSSGADTLY